MSQQDMNGDEDVFFSCAVSGPQLSGLALSFFVKQEKQADDLVLARELRACCAPWEGSSQEKARQNPRLKLQQSMGPSWVQKTLVASLFFQILPLRPPEDCYVYGWSKFSLQKNKNAGFWGIFQM